MKKSTSTQKPLLSLNEQHEYITLRTPNGNYTISFGGAKATGKLAAHPTAFRNIDKYVKNYNTYGEAMKTLLDPVVLSGLWAEWNEKVEDNTFLPNDNVRFNNNIFIKKYPNGGVVKLVKRKNVYILLADTNETIGFDYQFLTKV